MKKILVFIYIFTMFFVVKKEIYSLTAPYTPIIVITIARRSHEIKINKKFEELYKDKDDFTELNNILSTKEKELLSKNCNSKDENELYQKIRKKYKNEIILERERLKKEWRL